MLQHLRPALVLLLGVPVKEAVGTSLGVIALNSASFLLPGLTLLPGLGGSATGLASSLRMPSSASPLVSV